MTDRPHITVNARHFGDLVSQCWQAFENFNELDLFLSFGNRVVIVRSDAGRPSIKFLGKQSFKQVLDATAEFMRQGAHGLEPAWPPDDVISAMLETAELHLPRLASISEVPVFAPDGTLRPQAGYDPKTRYFIAAGLSVPPIPERPSAADIERAKAVIYELLVDFPFKSQADRANAVAAILLPFVRPLIKGPTPLLLIVAPTPGTGKGLLAIVIVLPAVGADVPMMPPAHSDDEWRKRITAVLRSAPVYVVIDNVADDLDSAALSAVLTATAWQDRELAKSDLLVLPVTTGWIATANNPRLSPEIARRTVTIHLDTGLERPWERHDFKHTLPDWALEHRGELVGAVLTLIRAWVVAGTPPGPATMGSFESFARVLGGILDVAGIPGFLENRASVYVTVDTEYARLLAFVDAWAERHGLGARVSAGTLLSLCQEGDLLPDVWSASHSDAGARTALGKWLSKRRDRIVAGRAIRASFDRHDKTTVYWLESVPAGDAGDRGGSSGPEEQEAETVRSPGNGIEARVGTPANPREPRADGAADEFKAL